MSADIARVSQRLRKLATGPTPREALRPGAEVLLDEMQSRVPVRSGTLRDSLRIVEERDDLVVGPGPAGFYGVFLEYGTARMSPHPWFRPAVDSGRRRAVAAIQREALRQIAKQMRGVL